MDRLFEAKILTCRLCGAQLNREGGGTILCDSGHELIVKYGVLDMYVAPAANRDPVSDDRENAILSAIADQMDLNGADLKAAKIFEPLPTTGNIFFDAEEEIFFDRFAFANVQPRLKVRRVYSNGRMQAGTKQWLAVRVENSSHFTITSRGAKPILLSYHWQMPDGSMLVFDGLRSPLPVDVKPGHAVTAHVAVEVPTNALRLRLKIVPVHEYVCWLEDDGESLDIDIVTDGAPRLPHFDEERPFSEALDDALSGQFLDRHLSSFLEPIIGIEIGGGTMAALSKWIWMSGKAGTIINGDVSIRLLRIAALLSAKGSDPVTVHSRFDANKMPIHSNALDVATFCRSLHHFEDPVRVMRECYRVLKPGGLLFLLCEPVAIQYDEPTKALIRAGVNEQVFPYDAYEAMWVAAGFDCVDAACDWGFSLKAALRKAV